MEGRGTLRLAPGELVICRPEFAGEWTIDGTYRTVAIHIEEGLLRKHIPDPMDLVGRSLELSPALNDILVRITDASIALSKEGRFGTADYLRVCRLEAARRLLSSTAFAERSITEIAFECGFTSSAHFSTEFRKRFGKSPREYRLPAQHERPPRSRE